METGHTDLNWTQERLPLLDNWHTFDRDKWFSLDIADSETDCIVLTNKQNLGNISEHIDIDWQKQDLLMYTVTMAPHLRLHKDNQTFLPHPLVWEATRFQQDIAISFDPPKLINPTFLVFKKAWRGTYKWQPTQSLFTRIDNLELKRDPSWFPSASYTDSEFILDKGADKTIVMIQDNAQYMFDTNMWNIYFHPIADLIAKRFPNYNVLSIRKRDPLQNVYKYGFAGYDGYSTSPEQTAKRVQQTFPDTEFAVISWCAGVHGALQLGIDIDAYSICLFDRFMHCMGETPMYQAAFMPYEYDMIKNSLLTEPRKGIHCFEVDRENNEFNDTQYATLSADVLNNINMHQFGRTEYEKIVSKKGNLLTTSLYKNGFMHLADYI